MLDCSTNGRFFVRIKELSVCPELEGKIVYIRNVTVDGVQLSLTDDCRPQSKTYQLPPESNDTGWYDVTDLVMAANTVILPKYSKCCFVSEVAQSYRNYVECDIIVLDEQQAIGHLCFIGTVTQRSATFSKQAYYIVASDKNGYILAYSGFCRAINEWEKPVFTQKILRLIGTPRKLYKAEPIVEAANVAFESDLASAEIFVQNIKETVAASSAESSVGKTVFSSGLQRLQLV